MSVWLECFVLDAPAMMTYFSSIGGFFKMDGRDPLQSDSQWGRIGLDGMGKVNRWMIGTDCEELAKGAWRLIVFVAGSGPL